MCKTKLLAVSRCLLMLVLTLIFFFAKLLLHAGRHLRVNGGVV